MPTSLDQSLAQAWDFLVPLIAVAVPALALYFVSGLAALAYLQRNQGEEMPDVLMVVGCMALILLLDGVRALWDSFQTTHFPVGIEYPIIVAGLWFGGNAARRLCIRRMQKHQPRPKPQGRHLF